jgi:hypothetical protein
MSSSPWERLWNGDEDVATPFRMKLETENFELTPAKPSPCSRNLAQRGRDAEINRQSEA